MKFQFWRHYHDLATIVSAAATAQRYSYCGASASVSVATLFYGCSLCLFVNNVAVTSQPQRSRSRSRRCFEVGNPPARQRATSERASLPPISCYNLQAAPALPLTEASLPPALNSFFQCAGDRRAMQSIRQYK